MHEVLFAGRGACTTLLAIHTAINLCNKRYRENDGGDSDVGGNTPLDWNIIQAIDISGMPSGWFELSISVDTLGNVVASFDGTDFMFTSSAGLNAGAFNVGYRENLQIGSDGTPDAIMRPPTFTLIPEPVSIAWVALGLATLALRRR